MRHGGIFVRVSSNRLRHITVNFGETKQKPGNINNTIKEMISEEMPLSEVVPAPKEGPENFELGGESGFTQRNISVEEAGEQ